MAILIVDGDNSVWRYASMSYTDCSGYLVRDIFNNAQKFEAEGIFVVWDGGSTRRKIINKAYKEGRKVDIDILRRKESLKKSSIETCRIVGLPQCLIPNEEGDDIIAKLVRDIFKSDEVIVMSTDHDFYSLIEENRVKIWNGKEITDIERFRSEYGIEPSEWVKLRSLSGDSSDNIPGIHGIGIKKGLKILQDGKFDDFKDREEVKSSRELLEFLPIEEEKIIEHLDFGVINSFAIKQMCEVFRMNSTEFLEQAMLRYNSERMKIWRCSFLKADMTHCNRCPMRSEVKQVVCWDGTVKSDIMFIGEAPGEDEDLHGVPFVGQAGTVFDEWMVTIGLKRSEVLISNIVWCRPRKGDKNRPPSEKEVATCSKFGIDRLVKFVMPKQVICLGGVASSYVFGRKISVTREYGNYQVTRFGFPMKAWIMLHPESVLYGDSNKRLINEQLEAMKRILREG